MARSGTSVTISRRRLSADMTRILQEGGSTLSPGQRRHPAREETTTMADVLTVVAKIRAAKGKAMRWRRC